MEFPKVPGCFDKSELSSLSECLGYPGDMLICGMKSYRSIQVESALKNLEAGLSSVSSKLLAEVLEQRHMNRNLEHLFNNHSTQYNQKVFKKAMQMLQHHKLGFSELYKARVSYELYSEHAGGGMRPEEDAVLPALKMAGKVMAPLQLESVLKRHHSVCDLPPNIQLYEFIDIVASAQSLQDVVKELGKQTESAGTSSTSVMLSSYERTIMTEDEQVLTHLDRKYKASLYKDVKPKAPPAQFSHVQLVSGAARKTVSVMARRELHALAPCLEVSQQNVHQARNGFVTLSAKQHKEISARMKTRRNKK